MKNKSEENITMNLDSNLNENGNIVLHSYYCPNCGSYYASKGPSQCVFCGEMQVTSIPNVDLNDYYVLPFVETLNDAIDDYKKKVQYNLFIPSVFRKKKTIKRIQKVYIPCIWYQAEVGGKISFLGTEKVKGVKAIPNQTFETGYTASFSFPKLLLCGYSKISDEIFSSICDYNLSVLKPFHLSLLNVTIYALDNCLLITPFFPFSLTFTFYTLQIVEVTNPAS